MFNFYLNKFVNHLKERYLKSKGYVVNPFYKITYTNEPNICSCPVCRTARIGRGRMKRWEKPHEEAKDAAVAQFEQKQPREHGMQRCKEILRVAEQLGWAIYPFFSHMATSQGVIIG